MGSADRCRAGRGAVAVKRIPAALAIVCAALPGLVSCSQGSSSSGASSGSTTTAQQPPSQNAGLALQQTYEQVVRDVSPAVAQIQTNLGLGSGEVFDTNGDVVTNNHVVEGATSVSVTLPDGTTHPAKVLGTFPVGDIAVVRINDVRNLHLTLARFADSSKVQVGEIVLAIGNPLGLRSSVTNGIVSALNRTVSEGTGTALPNTIQTSAAINPGNSGGALVDLQGAVIGIPTLAATDPQLGGGAAPGIGFAIPSNTAVDIARQIIKFGKVLDSHRAYMGVTLTDIPTGGVGIVSVQPGTPAAQAGIKPGTQLVAIDGTPVQSVDQVSVILAQRKPGDTIKLTLMTQARKKETVALRLAQYPGTTGG